MNEKYPRTCIEILNSDTQTWYETEQCWNCEPEELRKMRIQKNRPVKKRFAKQL